MRARRATGRVIAAAGGTFLTLALTAASARAQDVPLAIVLPELVLREITLVSPVSGLSHVAHFSPIAANEPNNPAVGIRRTYPDRPA